MARYPRHVDLPKGATGPAIYAYAKEPDGDTISASGATTPKFYFYDFENETFIAEASDAGVTIESDDPLQIQRVLQTADTASEVKSGCGYFSYVLGGKTHFSRTFGLTVTEPYKRPTN